MTSAVSPQSSYNSRMKRNRTSNWRACPRQCSSAADAISRYEGQIKPIGTSIDSVYHPISSSQHLPAMLAVMRCIATSMSLRELSQAMKQYEDVGNCQVVICQARPRLWPARTRQHRASQTRGKLNKGSRCSSDTRDNWLPTPWPLAHQGLGELG